MNYLNVHFLRAVALGAVLLAHPFADCSAQDTKPASKSPIEVTSVGGANIDSENNSAVYFEKVVFKHPDQQLTVTCDKLEVFRDPNAVSADGQAEVKTAIATGNVVITKIDAEGKKKLGKCGRAVFDASTNNVEMSEKPSLLEGKNLILAASPTTVFTLREDGKHQFKGPVKTEFLGGDK